MSTTPFYPRARALDELPSASTHLRPEGFSCVDDERRFFFEETSVRAFACPDGVVRLVCAINWFWEALAGPIAEHFEASEAEVVDLAWEMAERDPFDCGEAFSVYLLFVIHQLMAEFRVETGLATND